MYMKDWINRLDSILQLNGRDLLTHAGKISHELALEKSNVEYEKYKAQQKQLQKEHRLKEIEEDIKKNKTAITVMWPTTSSILWIKTQNRYNVL